MLAMAQLLNIQMPGSYELSFPPQNPDMPGFDGPGKGPSQSGMRVESCGCRLNQCIFLCYLQRKTSKSKYPKGVHLNFHFRFVISVI